MPFSKIFKTNLGKGVCQLTCDCGHSPSKTAEEYEIPFKNTGEMELRHTIKILVALIKVMIII